MLALPIHTRAGLVTIRDDSNDARVFVATAQPRVARRDDGSPRIRLVQWAAPPGIPASELPTVGGRLTIEVDVLPTPEELAAAGFDADQVRPIPWTNATVRLDGPDFETVMAEVSLSTSAPCALTANLSRRTASVLASFFLADVGVPLQLTWIGNVRLRLPAIEVVATADVDEISRRVESIHGAVETIVVRSLLEANARVRIEGGQNAELETALRDWVFEELTTRFTQGEELVVRAAASDVVSWPIRLAATIDEGSLPLERSELVHKIVLEPGELGRVPPIEVRALGDFSGPLERIDIGLQAKTGGNVFNISLVDDTVEPVSLSTADFRWRYRIKFVSRPVAEWSEWREVEGSYGLVIPVSVLSSVDIEVIAAGLDFDTRWHSVRVALEHSVPGTPVASHVIVLDATHRSETWERQVDGIRGALRATLTYLSKQGLSIEQTLNDIENDQVVVGDPFDHGRLRLTLMPTGSGWSEVALVMVDLRYRDGTYHYEETVGLKGLDDFVQWEVPIRPDGPRGVEWRYHASFTDGRFEQSGWQQTDAAVLTIPLVGAPRRDVQLLPVHFDAETTSLLEVQLSSGGQTETVVVKSSTPQTAVLPPGPFRWKMHWTLTDGTSGELGEQDSNDDVIVLPNIPN